MFDLVIRNGYVADPSGRVSSRLNVGVKSGSIAAVTIDHIEGETEIDADGLVVAPGFIDMHMHEDPYDSDRDTFDILIADSMLKMGVTTAIGGNCGIGAIENPVKYLDAADRLGYPVNIGMLSPHANLRKAFGDFSRYAAVDRHCIEGMGELLQIHLDGGCLGLSLGMEYIPGVDRMEAVELMRFVEKNHSIVAVHQRSDGDRAVPSVKELTGYAEETGAKLQISHLSSMCSFGSMPDVLSIIDSSRSKGVDILFDGYPYYAFCTSIGSAVFDEGFLDKYGYGDEYFSRMQVDGESGKGKEMNREAFYSIRQKDPDTLVVAHILDGEEVDLCLTHPAGIVVSDGLYSNGQGHPRGSGTFPRLIREYVLERKLLTLDQAVEKITWLPAQRMGLKGKGSLKPGSDADITIFDLNRIRDGATYQEPLKPPVGIEYVIINGQIALKGGEIKNGRLGRAVRK